MAAMVDNGGMRALSLLALLTAGAAHADEDKTKPIAASHFQLGEQLYLAGQYAEAAAQFEEARKLMPRPDLDFNIGRCRERMKDWQGAIDAYTRYIEATPTPLDAEQILLHITELKGIRDRENAGRVLAPMPPPPQDRRAGRIAGLLLAGIGFVAVGVGVGMGVAGDQAAEAATARDRGHLPYDPSLDTQIHNDRLAQGVLIGAGAAVLVAGIVTMAVSYRRAPATTHARLMPLGVRF
jgi:hypothetical protein